MILHSYNFFDEISVFFCILKYLESISLVQFKNYSYQHFSFDTPVIAIIGKNGSGKTNLLDSIYYLCFTKSYFNSKEINNVQRTTDGFRIEGNFIDEGDANKIICIYRDQKKSLTNNGKNYEKLSQHIGFQSAVMIAPDDINIINGYSENRRKFIDGLLSQMDAEYLTTLLSYQKYLAQKQNYLKNTYPISKDLLQIYNDQIYLLGLQLFKKRKEFTAYFSPIVEKYYGLISNAAERVEFSYKSDVIEIEFSIKLQQLMDYEIQSRRCQIGVHLDDWDLLINDLSLKSQGSQGQKKSYLLALKLAQIQSLNDSGHAPILLLDDIFEKLDSFRLDAFFESLDGMSISQIFLTHTDNYLIEKIVKKHYPNTQIIELNK